MAINEYNTDLDVKGRVLATTVPNSTGSIVTWNSTSKVFGLRSNAQIISDLNLSSNFVPYTGATQNVNLGTRSITSTGGFIGNASTATTLATSRTINGTSFNGSDNITTASWGTARNITIGNTTKSVNGSANVSWSLAEIGAVPNISGGYLEKASLALSPLANWDTLSENRIVRSTSGANSPFSAFGIGINLYGGSDNFRGQLFFNQLNNGTLQFRSANSTGWSAVKTVATVDQIPTSSDYITTNTNQTGLSGNKTTSGVWTFENTQVPIALYRPTGNNSIRFTNDSRTTYLGFSLNGDNFVVADSVNLHNIPTRRMWVDSSGLVSSQNGFNKYGKTDSSVLLAGGGDRPVSDFALESSISNFWSRDKIQSQVVSSVTDLNTALPNGGFITSYSSGPWGGSDRPNSGSYGGFIRFQGQANGNNSLDFYYNNGHGSLTNNRLWFRTVNSTGVTNWLEMATREWANNRFALASSIITPNNGLLTISTSSDLTGGGTFSADQATASNVDIGLSAGTLDSIANGQTAYNWGDHASAGYLVSSDLSGYATETWVKSFGIGKPITEYNNISVIERGIPGGLYSTNTGTTGGPLTGASGSLLSMGSGVTNGTNSFIWITGNNANSPRAFFTHAQNTGEMNPWEEIASQSWVSSQGFSTQTLSSSTSNIISGSTVQRAALTGDVTASQNSNVTTIANSAVTHAKYQNIATQRILGRGATGTGNVQELTLGANLTLSTAGVLSATNTNTTYSAGTGLSLSGTTFGQAITTSGSGTYVQSITQTASGFQVNLGTPPNTNTTYSAGTVALLTAGTNQTNRVWRADYLNQGIKALTYNPDNLTFGSGLNYNTSTGVLTADLDSIFAYSPQGGLYTTNWSSNALGQYSLAIGHASNATAQNATAVGSAVFTGGFGSTNVGFSSNVNKSLAGNFGTYNTNNHREAFTYGLGLQTASTWQTVIGRYNRPNGAGDIDDWTNIRNPIFILGVGQDSINRKNSISAYGDGRIGYEMDRDETYWDEYTIPDIKWIQENVSGGGNSIPFVNEGELIEEDGILISGLSVKGYDVTSGTIPTGLNSIYVSNLDYLTGGYVSVDTANVYNRIVVSTSNGGRPAVSNGTISLDGNISGNDVTEITNMLSNRRMLLCIVLTNDGVEYSIAEISLLGTEEIVGITTSDPTIKIVKVGSFYQKEGRLFIDVDPKII